MSSHLRPANIVGRIGRVGLLLSLGVDGVDVFFVLSGFLITGILFDSLGDDFYFRKFYARRVLRIFPLYYGVLAVLLLLTHPLHIEWNGLQYSLLLYLQNTHFLFPSLIGFDSPYFTIDHLWSLAVEEQFYLMWPLLLFLLRRPRSIVTACVAGIALSFCLRVWGLEHGWGFNWINRNLFCRMDEMLGGAALAMLLRTRLAEGALRLSVPVFCVGIAGEALLFSGVVPVTWATSLNYTLLILVSAGLLGWCMQPGSVAKRAFEWKPLRWLGKYSYGLYVLHLLLQKGITRLMWTPVHALLHGEAATKLAIIVANFVLSTLAAYLSFQLYEKHFLKLKRFFDYDRRPAAPEAAAAV